ncbi:hypothetical protein OEZ86_000994 [Tetradesmus obliquus]|nr:hypothetical protein OEZ86_000994 [Tetradesmus obliquus]
MCTSNSFRVTPILSIHSIQCLGALCVCNNQQQQLLQDIRDNISTPGAVLDLSEEQCDVLCSSVGKLCQLLGQEQPSELLQQRLQGFTQQQQQQRHPQQRHRQQQQLRQQYGRRNEQSVTEALICANFIRDRQLLLPLASACITLSAALEQQLQQQQRQQQQGSEQPQLQLLTSNPYVLQLLLLDVGLAVQAMHRQRQGKALLPNVAAAVAAALRQFEGGQQQQQQQQQQQEEGWQDGIRKEHSDDEEPLSR